MRITDVRPIRLSSKVTKPFGYSRQWVHRREALLVQVVTDEGVTGWGEAFGPALLSHAAIELLRPTYLGADPFSTEVLWQGSHFMLREHGRKGPVMDALSAIDIALWDIKGKATGMPVHRLLGGPFRSQIPAYASGLFRLEGGTQSHDLAREAAGYIERGYGAVKMKVGFGVEADAAAIDVVREAVGPAAALMIDANGAYDSADAVALCRRLGKHEIAWFEEPVPPDDLEGYRKVRAATAISIAGGEAEFTRWGFRDLLLGRAVDIIQPDICAAGGFTECVKIAAMAEAFGIRCVPHVWGTPVALAASLHWLAAMPQCQMSMHPVEPLLEFDCTEHPIRDAMLPSSFKPMNGVVQVPDGPGLGIDVDEDALRVFAAS